MTAARPELLAIVERSPQAAAAHDRAAWIGLFADDARIEDPVGSRPHIGRAQIGRFYDTFIAPRRIVFHRDFDVVQGTTVVRDLTLEVGMESGLTMHIPAYLRYDLRPEDGQWAIAALRAYWELPKMVGQMLRQGAKAVPTSTQLAAALLRHQGIAGAAGFLTGVKNPGKRGKKLLEQALSTPTGAIPEQGRLAKPIAAGDTVVASITTPTARGVLFAQIGGNQITRVQYFVDSASTSQK